MSESTVVNFQKESASGGRSGWARTFTTVSESETGVSAFCGGAYLKEGEQRLKVGDFVVEIRNCGSAKHGVSYPVFHRVSLAGLVCVFKNDDDRLDWRKNFESIRKIAQNLTTDSVVVVVESPLAGFSTAEIEAELARRAK